MAKTKLPKLNDNQYLDLSTISDEKKKVMIEAFTQFFFKRSP